MMAVYVDDMEAPYRGMVMCHMAADTTEELVAMARRIGVPPKWIQYPGTQREHFDICRSKRKRAVLEGAIEVTQRELALRIGEKRVAHRPGPVDGDPAKSFSELNPRRREEILTKRNLS